MAQHAEFSPSGLDRRMLCPGSMAMEQGLPSESSPAADEGTAAHLLGSTCLEHGVVASAYVGNTIQVGTLGGFDGAIWVGELSGFSGDQVLEVVRAEYIIDDEMAEYVQGYVNAVLFFASTCVGSTVLPEQRLSISTYTGEEEAHGTSDAVVIAGNELQVHDLKYGYKKVYAKKNRQLMMYALAALEAFEMLSDFERITLVIHQPRVDETPDEWSCSVAELLAFGEEVKTAAFHARACLTEKPGALIHHLRPSSEACLWCKAKPTCPALARHVKDIVAAEFEDMTLPEDKKAVVVLPPVPASGEDLGAKFEACDLIELWIEAVRAEVRRSLMSGLEVPSPKGGYKLVAGRRGARAWKEEDEVIDKVLKGMTLKEAERYTYKLISPTAAEKIFGAKGSQPNEKRWARLQAMYAQPDGKPTIALMHDKRDALVMTSADDFDDVTGDDLS